MYRYKGLADLVRCERFLASRRDDVEFVVAGSGPELSKARKGTPADSRFVWREGFIPDEEVAQLFAESDVVALPYVEASMSGVLGLAAVFGKPVVATHVGSLPEVVGPYDVGLLVPPEEPEALACAILRLRDDPDLRERLGKNARRLAETAWSHPAVAERAKEIYRGMES